MNIRIPSLKLLFQGLLLSLMFCGTAFASEKVNINTADAATLARVLHNVGAAKAEAIVEYRREHGAFRSAEQLAQVRGIGLKTVERNADRIDIADPSPAPRNAAAKPAARQVVRTP
ncbi:MAG: ComEA family DNA-binding protein [Pseudoxanthomonas suwonensis]|nr:ComEA family DNA-binding protein [Pseudoxanthomonas suwonensis]